MSALVSAMSCLSQRDGKRRAEQRRRGVRFMIRFVDSFTQRNAEAQEPRLASPARTKGTKRCPDLWFHNRPTYLPPVSLCNTICDAEVSACVCACVRGCVCLCVVCTEERRRRRRRGRRRRRSRRRRRRSDLSMYVCVYVCACDQVCAYLCECVYV